MTPSIHAISPLRQRMLDDMRMRKLEPRTQESMPQPPIQPVNDDDKLEFLPMYEMLPNALGRGGLTYQPRVTYVIREKPPQSYE